MMKKKYYWIVIIFIFQWARSQQELLPVENQSIFDNHSEILTQIWELDKNTKRGTFKPLTYRPMYILPLRWTDNFNRKPLNWNPLRAKPQYKEYQNIETKFQISLKTKIIQDAFWGRGDFWVAYTQTAYWQVYNGGLSRPFRELNYEPELMFVMPLNISIKKIKWHLVSLSINHQSNGKEHTLSRSWNRIILSTAFQWENYILTAQTYWRIAENTKQDDNPFIDKYIGRYELNLFYNVGESNSLNVKIRNNLNFSNNKHYVELLYSFPILGNLKGLLQVSHGYGDSLIEYNHKQLNIGLGFILFEL